MTSSLPSAERTIGEVDLMGVWTWLSVTGTAAALLLAMIGGSPIDLPMPSHLVGLVTPTCGLTRGTTALVRGDAALAWSYNPAAFVVAALGAAGLARALIGIALGRWFGVVVRLHLVGRAAVVVGVALLWINQQSNADFVMHARL